MTPEKPQTVEEWIQVVEYLSDLRVENLAQWTQLMRYYARSSLFFLMNFVLSWGRQPHNETKEPIFLHPVYLEHAEETQWQLDNEGGGDYSARGFGKSTWRTWAGSIYLINKHPDIAIAIGSWEKAVAIRWVQGLMEELESNQLLINLFPDVYWAGGSREEIRKMARANGATWSRDTGELQVRRRINRLNPTVQAFRFEDGTPTGSRFDVVMLDDTENEKLVRDEETIARAKTAYSSTARVLTPVVVQRAKLLYTNTRYAKGGLAQWTYDTFAAESKRKVIANPGEDLRSFGEGPLGGTARYPKTLSELYLQFRHSPDVSDYALQIALNYSASRPRVFEEDWVVYYDEEPADLAKKGFGYLLIDPSRGVKDPTCVMFIVTLPGANRRIALIDVSRTWLDATTSAWDDEIFRIAARAKNLSRRLMQVRVESVGQSTFDRTVRESLERGGIRGVPVVRFSVNMRAQGDFADGKTTRIWDRLAGPLSRRQILLPRPVSRGGAGIAGRTKTGAALDLIQVLTEQELFEFPLSSSLDMMDTLSLAFEPDEVVERAGGKVLEFPRPKSRRRRTARPGRSWMSA